MFSDLRSIHRLVLELSIAGAATAIAGCGPQSNSPGSSTSTPTTATLPASALAPADTRANTLYGAAPLKSVDGAIPRAGQPVPPATPINDAGPTMAPVPSNAPQMPPATQAKDLVARPAPQAMPGNLLGKVSSIESIRERPPGTGKGAVVGGVLGALVGNQFGRGSGKAAMTVVGAAGGAVAGNNVERNINKRVVGYRITVRLDNGASRVYEQPSLAGLRVGDRIRVEGRHVRRV